MRILIAMPDEGESAQLANVLKKGGHEVRSAREESAIAATLVDQSPHLVLVGTNGPNESLLTMLRTTSTAPCRPHVLCIHSGLTDDFVPQLLEAGADGEMRRPLAGRYFLARLGAIQRRVEPPKATPDDRLMFLDGVSTAAEVTDISGRGVGMGALMQVARDKGGQIEVESQRGAGSLLRLRLPAQRGVAARTLLPAA